jgi:enoyl-CoA hydratase
MWLIPLYEVAYTNSVTKGGIMIRVEERRSRVLTITLDRPPVNAANKALLDELRQVLLEAHDTDLDAMVLTGAGSVFCAGNDLHEFAAMTTASGEELMRSVRLAFWALYDCPFPVIARVNGAALGTGLALASLCDLVVASENAVFGLPELDVGVLGGVKFCRRFVPELAMRRLYFTSERVSAATFAALGASLTVVPHSNLDQEVDALLDVVTAKGAVGLRYAKQAMNAVEALDMRTGYEYEQTFTVRMADRPESKQAVNAVLDDLARRRGGEGGTDR